MRLRERLYIGVFAPLLILSGAFLLTSERRVFGNGARIEITAVYNPVLNFGVAVSDGADLLIMTKVESDNESKIIFGNRRYWHFTQLAGSSNRGGVDYPEN